MTPRLRFSASAAVSPRFLFQALCFGAVLTPVGALHAAGEIDIFQSIGEEVNAIFEKAKPAIVRVRSGGEELALAGTGFFIDDQGTVLTSSSLIDPNSPVTVEVNGSPLEARIIGNDARSGLAMLQVDYNGGPYLHLGHSTDLKTGYAVVTLGYPLNLPVAPSQGLISGFDVRYLNLVLPTTHIRANVNISPGQVGGPLLNTRGEVVGLVAPSPDSGQSIYALPVEAMEKIIGDFREFGRAKHGWVGVDVVEEADASHDGRNVQVLRLQSGTPASTSGILPGDTVMRIDSREVYRPADVLDASFFSRVGENMTVVVRRETALLTYSFRVIERPPRPTANLLAPAANPAPALQGIPVHHTE